MIERELTDNLCMIKGFFSGILFAASILSGYGFTIQLIIFLIALFVFIENIVILGHHTHVFTAILFNIFGIVVSFIFWVFNLVTHLTIFSVILIVVLYLYYVVIKAQSK